ncbi:hypothetical protein GCM10010252_27190 [Streptomyces aureoverticillatus]|nr:hypothetical protein GCM10010252_27190 [Streptomyces aureoverticillatus]
MNPRKSGWRRASVDEAVPSATETGLVSEQGHRELVRRTRGDQDQAGHRLAA